MEFIIQMIIEVFGELILTLVAKLFEVIAIEVTLHSKLKNKLKNIFSFLMVFVTTILIILSFIHTKNFLVVIALSYSLLQLSYMIVNLVTKKDKRFLITNKILFVIKKISHYAYPIVLIVFGSIYLTNEAAIIWLNVISSIGLFLVITLDIYRIWRYYRKDIKPRD